MYKQQSFDCNEELAFIYSELSGDSSKAQIPLSIWKSKLIEQGLQCEALIDFFCRESLLELWRNPKSLKEVYLEAVSANASTTAFIENIINEENDYAEQATAAIDSLVEERESLMSTAGGNMKHPIIGGVGISALLAVGIGVAIWKKDTVGSWRRRLLNREVAQIENEAEQQLDHDPMARANQLLIDRIDSRDANGTFIDNELGSLAHNSGLNLEETSTQVRRKVERDEIKILENPQAFLEDAIKTDPANFKLDLIGFWTDGKEIRDAGIQKIQKAIADESRLIVNDWAEYADKYSNLGKQELKKELRQCLLENTLKDGEAVLSKEFEYLDQTNYRSETRKLIVIEKEELRWLSDVDYVKRLIAEGMERRVIKQEIQSHKNRLEFLVSEEKDSTSIIERLEEPGELSAYGKSLINDVLTLNPTQLRAIKLLTAFKIWHLGMASIGDIERCEADIKEYFNGSNEKLETWKTNKLFDIKEYYGEELAAAAEKKFNLNVQERIEKQFKERAEKALEVDFDNAAEIEAENIEQLIEPEIESEVESLIEEEVENIEQIGGKAVQILDSWFD